MFIGKNTYDKYSLGYLGLHYSKREYVSRQDTVEYNLSDYLEGRLNDVLVALIDRRNEIDETERNWFKKWAWKRYIDKRIKIAKLSYNVVKDATETYLVHAYEPWF